MARRTPRSPQRTKSTPHAAPERKPGASRRSHAPDPAPGLSLANPWLLIPALVAAACAVLAVTIRIYDTDFWHHLLAGRVIWQTHAIPLQQVWAWSTYGTPDMNASPLFRVLVWPFWSIGGLTGLYAWRWLTTLAAFGILWAAARRMGARGLSPLLVIVLCILVYRQRSQIRPETLAAVLMALQVWILETRRMGGRDFTWWLVGIAWVWANSHISWYLGFVLLGLHVVDSMLPGAAAPLAKERRIGPFPKLIAVTLAAALVSFVNPFGWRALWLPFEFMLFLRSEAIYRTIGELQPVMWSNNARNGLPVLVVVWPLLLLWRARRFGLDRVEAILCALFTIAMLNTQRLTGVYSLLCAPYLARDLDAWIASRPWPAWTRPAAVRGGVTALLIAGIAAWEFARIELPMGMALDQTRYPIRAADMIRDWGIRGRGYNDAYLGGYLAWRFWPEKERLPFMTGTPEAATKEDRALTTLAAREQGAGAWQQLDAKYGFDYAVLNRRYDTGAGAILDFLDRDPAWALVFLDDAAAVYVRRTGPLAGVADAHGYQWLAGGTTAMAGRFDRAIADSSSRLALIAELERASRESPWDARTQDVQARLAFGEGRLDDARRHLERAVSVSPLTVRLHERLGLIALTQSRPADALAEFQRERRNRTTSRGLEIQFGRAYQALGDRARAIRHYRAELKLDPDNRAASDSLAVLGSS
jgi:tetratricopeptide (TPR) repeat protein